MLWAPFTKIHKIIFQKEVTPQLLTGTEVRLHDLIIEKFAERTKSTPSGRKYGP
jgi:hypothetical protein